MIKITLNDHRAISWNKLYSSPHWSKRKELADEIHFRVKIACKGVKSISGRVDILVVAMFKGKTALDSSNICVKLYEDGLVGAGIIVDDSPEYVRMVSMESMPNVGKDSVNIFIEEVELPSSPN
jgi:hypothetical protein